MWFNNKEKAEEQPKTVRPLPSPEEVEANLKQFITTRTKLVALDEIQPSMALFSSGLLDSLSFVQMIAHLETYYRVRFPRTMTMSVDRMDRIDQIVPVTMDLLKSAQL